MDKVLNEALKLSPRERVAMAEKLLASVDDDGSDDDDVQAAWASVVELRSRELRDGTVKGLTAEEARRIVAADPPDADP